MAYILPDPAEYRMATPAPLCPHGTAYAQPCCSCGWTCPSCKRNYAPWVRECNYRHEEESGPVLAAPQGPVPPGEITRMQLAVPPEMTQPGYQRVMRADREWRQAFPGLQVMADLSGQAQDKDTGFVTVRLRLTPAENPDGTAQPA